MVSSAPLAETSAGSRTFPDIYIQYKHLGDFLRVDAPENGVSPLRA